jgi:hypothetical protein
MTDHKHKPAATHKKKTTRKSELKLKSYHIPKFSSHAHIHTHWAMLIMVVWVLIGAVTGGALVRAHYQRTHNTVTVKVTNTSYDKKGKQPFLPGTGYQFVIVDVAIANNTDQTFNLAPVIQSYLTDEQGNTYQMAPALLDHPLAAGRLADNVSTTGTLSYVVPQNVSRLTFHFNADTPQHIRYQHTLPTSQD